MFIFITKFLYVFLLISPIGIAKYEANLENLTILFGLVLQGFLGSFIFFYIRGYEVKNQNLVYFGYSIIFLGLSGAYLSEKSVWFLFFWELSTIGTILIYLGDKLKATNILSIVSLLIASGTSLVFLAFWVFSEPESSIGNYCLLIGLLLKSAFSGLHLWLPEAYSGAPAHGSATYSGILVNLPILLLIRNAQILSAQVSLLQLLILLASLGIFLGGIASFFNRDIKKSLAYSSIENTNLLLLLLFLYVYFYYIEDSFRLIGEGFLFLLFITFLHQSIGKVYQFLSFGYIARIAQTTSLDEAKGFGRVSGLSFSAMTLGTLSFCGVPGTLGFLSEGSFLYMASLLLDLPISKSIFILPSLIFLSIGLAFGAANHLRLYLSLVLSIPQNANSASTPNKTITTTLEFLGLSIFTIPIALFIFHNIAPDVLEFPIILEDWLYKVGILSTGVTVFLFIVYKWRFHKISKRVTWDCGSGYKERDVSIPASVISEPLYESVGRYMSTQKGESKVDSFVFNLILSIFQRGRLWIQFTEGAELSTYLFISALSVLVAISIVIFLSGFSL